jgi:putative heme iron utilization protein
MIKIENQNIVKKLIELPETGMGYQHVTFLMKDGSTFNGLVFNCENIELKDEEVGKFKQEDIVDVIDVENKYKGLTK